MAVLTNTINISAVFTNVTGGPVQFGKHSLQAVSPSGGNCTITFTFVSHNVAGNLIYVFLGVFDGGLGTETTAVVTDTQGNSYNLIAQAPGSGDPTGYAFYASNVAAGANVVTVAVASGSALDMDLIVAEYPANGASVTLDQFDFDSEVWNSVGFDNTPSTSPNWWIVGAYCATYSQFTWDIKGLDDTTNAALVIREQTANPGGETAALADVGTHITHDYLITAAIPAPAWPPANNQISRPAVIDVGLAAFQPIMGEQLTGMNFRDNLCGPFEYYDAATNTNRLYVILSGGASTPSPLQAYMSADGGLTWAVQDSAHAPSAQNLNTALPCSKFGSKIGVLYTNSAGPLLVANTFDMSTNLWGTATGQIPNTSNAGTGPTNNVQIYDIFCPFAGEFIVAWTDNTPTFFTLTQVAVAGGHATYSYSSFTGAYPYLGNKIGVTGFTNSGNNVSATITALSGGSSGTITVVATTQVNETHAGSGGVGFYRVWAAYYSGSWTVQEFGAEETAPGGRLLSGFFPDLETNSVYALYNGYDIASVATVDLKIVRITLAVTALASVVLSSPGAGGYSSGDILAINGGGGGTVIILTVDGSGNPTTYAIATQGAGYSLGVQTTTGGTGSGATFNVTGLGSISVGPPTTVTTSTNWGGKGPGIGIGCVWRGTIYFGFGPTPTIYSNPGGVWGSTAILPAGYNPTARNGYSWCLIINDVLYVFWIQADGSGYTQRLMYTLSYDGTFNPAVLEGLPISFYDMGLNGPNNMTAAAGWEIFEPSLAVIFGSRIGIKLDLAWRDAVSGTDFLTSHFLAFNVGASSPPAASFGNSFY